MTSLRTLQQNLQNLILSDEQDRQPLTSTLIGSEKTAGLDVYHSAYRLRLCGVLALDFPVLQSAMGKMAFETLCLSYLNQHVSRSFSVRYLGTWLADFLNQQAWVENHPALAELARFEWGLIDALDAAECPSLQMEDLQTIAPEDRPQLILRAQASVQLYHFNWSITDYYPKPGSEPGAELVPASINCLIWRQAQEVKYRLCEDDEAAAIRAISEGVSFEHLALLLSEQIDQQQVPQRLADLLSVWINEGLISAPCAGRRSHHLWSG